MTTRTQEATEAVNRLVAQHGNNYRVAQVIGVNSGHLSSLLKDGRLSPTLDNALVRTGILDPLPHVVQVIACPACGEGHTVAWCTKELGEPKRPRVQRGIVSNRISIQRHRPDLAAAAILRLMKPAVVTELIEELESGLQRANGHSEATN